MTSGKGDFEVAWWVDRLGGHIERHPGFWIKLGNIETKVLRDELSGTAVEATDLCGGACPLRQHVPAGSAGRTCGYRHPSL